MREIKFKAWDRVEEIMFNVGAIAWSHNAFNNKSYVFGTNPHCYEDKCNSYVHLNEDCIFMQYVGLKDKNGIEIYENDILKCINYNGDYENYIVSWDKEECCYNAWNKNKTNFMSPSIWNEFEVIGNIYESPALLENSERSLKYNTIYRHFKGKKYIVICKSTPIDFETYVNSTVNINDIVAKHTETGNDIKITFFKNGNYHHLDSECKDDLVIYMGLYAEHQIYARPYGMFMSKVDKEKYPEVEQEYRFEEEE